MNVMQLATYYSLRTVVFVSLATGNDWQPCAQPVKSLSSDFQAIENRQIRRPPYDPSPLVAHKPRPSALDRFAQ